MNEQMAAPDFREEMAHGFVRRWATPADAERVAALQGEVWRLSGDEQPNLRTVDAVRQMMTPGHPLTSAGDCAVVEDHSQPGTPLVASAFLWRHEWEYEWVRFPVGRPEIVGTLQSYRRRGLVRSLMEMLHARSEAAGHLVQGINGIPYFYRQFGYEYALDLGGRRLIFVNRIPDVREREISPYRLRQATADDIPFLGRLYQAGRRDSMLWRVHPVEEWRHEVAERPGTTGEPERFFVIVDINERPCGYVGLGVERYGADLQIYHLELEAGQNWQAAALPLLRLVRAYGAGIPAVRSATPPYSEICLFLGRDHPLYGVLPPSLAAVAYPPYAWYVRVPQLPAFLHRIAPVLEQRLAASPVAGFSGVVELDFYRDAISLHFEQGRLASVEEGAGHASGLTCPPLVFLQLLFGHRDLGQLRGIYPDVAATPQVEPVVRALFPARPSRAELGVWPWEARPAIDAGWVLGRPSFVRLRME